MIVIYRLLALPFLLLTAPFYIRRKLRRGGLLLHWQQRLGFIPVRLREKAPGKKRIWIQAVSVGEILAIQSLIEQFRASGHFEIVLTTTTSTGYQAARKCYGESLLFIGLFPIDFFPCSTLAWSRIQPDCIVLAESELWPEHLHQASRHSIPVYLINARLSDRSYRRMKAWSLLSRFLLSKVGTLFCATQVDYERFLDLGAGPEKAIGNIKLDVPFEPPMNMDEKIEALRAMGLQSNKRENFTLIGASTWEGEESTLLEAQQACLEAGIDCRLILVPRHVERREALMKHLRQQKLAWSSASGAQSSTSENSDIQIFLADTTGALVQLLRLADLAFIGKSLSPHQGGQTPIEAAAQGIPLLMGPNMSNFTSISKALIKAGAALQVADAEELKLTILNLASDADTRSKMGVAGQHWHKSNKGISGQIYQHILSIFSLSDSSSTLDF